MKPNPADFRAADQDRHRMRISLLSALPAIVCALMFAGDSHAQAPADAKAPVAIQEWTVPWEKTRPRDPYVDAKSRVWFVGQSGNYIAFLEPGTGKFTRFEID